MKALSVSLPRNLNLAHLVCIGRYPRWRWSLLWSNASGCTPPLLPACAHLYKLFRKPFELSMSRHHQRLLPPTVYTFIRISNGDVASAAPVTTVLAADRGQHEADGLDIWVSERSKTDGVGDLSAQRISVLYCYDTGTTLPYTTSVFCEYCSVVLMSIMIFEVFLNKQGYNHTFNELSRAIRSVERYPTHYLWR